MWIVMKRNILFVNITWSKPASVPKLPLSIYSVWAEFQTWMRGCRFIFPWAVRNTSSRAKTENGMKLLCYIIDTVVSVENTGRYLFFYTCVWEYRPNATLTVKTSLRKEIKMKQTARDFAHWGRLRLVPVWSIFQEVDIYRDRITVQ